MATSTSTIDDIEDQLSGISEVHSQKMFGEYALYVGKKVVALVCDDTLFVKMTEQGKIFIGDHYKEGFPYPGAKPWIEVDALLFEDRRWLCELVRLTEESLPIPKFKKRKGGRKK